MKCVASIPVEFKNEAPPAAWGEIVFDGNQAQLISCLKVYQVNITILYNFVDIIMTKAVYKACPMHTTFSVLISIFYLTLMHILYYFIF